MKEQDGNADTGCYSSVPFSVHSHSVGFYCSEYNMRWFESTCLSSIEVKDHRLYQCTLLHLSVTLLHLLDGVFPLVDELLCLQVGLLQILCSLIQSNLLEKQRFFFS